MEEVRYDIRDMTKDIQNWLDEVYPDRTLDSTLAKLREELQELSERPLDGWEAADVVILLFDLCDIVGFDLAKLVHHKMNINRKRKWVKTDGVLKHVED